MTLNSDVGVIQVAVAYMSLRSVNCFETAASWDAKLEGITCSSLQSYVSLHGHNHQALTGE